MSEELTKEDIGRLRSRLESGVETLEAQLDGLRTKLNKLPEMIKGLEKGLISDDQFRIYVESSLMGYEDEKES